MPNKRLKASGKKAVILLSGGLDSAVALYFAKKQGFKCHCLVFDYHQRHRREIKSARAVAESAGSPIEILKIHLPAKGSSLLDANLRLTTYDLRLKGIPATYVPGRNIIFLSFALSFAETEKASAIFIGAHAQDYSGYPDCRPDFYRDFRRVAKSGTKVGVEGRPIEICTPLIHKTKAQIIKMGKRLGVPFALTWSCYRGARVPCGKCDSCYYRIKGFKEAGIKDI
ncbi:MAG: 7-cyano-7-deazaguanine synthase QueC [Candidatus Omnitrophica bacterium]|nr:7-cyano-7-deazaguanine synthase QueC [Candidatus Omnitrophota bacterium]